MSLSEVGIMSFFSFMVCVSLVEFRESVVRSWIADWGCADACRKAMALKSTLFNRSIVLGKLCGVPFDQEFFSQSLGGIHGRSGPVG